MKVKEEEHMLCQTQNFTSTVSHEMRTPILSIIFFITSVMRILQAFNATSKRMLSDVELAIRYCEDSYGQLEFLQSFIEDLIDLRMIKTGKFSLEYEPFDIMEVMSLIYSVFMPQVKFKML